MIQIQMFPRWVKQAEQLPLNLVGSREDLANSYTTPQVFGFFSKLLLKFSLFFSFHSSFTSTLEQLYVTN